MTFQAYLDNIQTKTGKSPDDFKQLAAQKGYTETVIHADEPGCQRWATSKALDQMVSLIRTSHI